MEYVRFVSIIKPKFFVLENVSGLLSLEKGKFKQDILERFNQLGYNVDFRLLTASDYGVPQSRKRVFFVGLRKDIFENEYFNFDKLTKRNIVSTKDAISDLPNAVNHKNPVEYVREPITEFQKYIRRNSTHVYNHELTNHTQQTVDIISLVPDGGGIRDLPEEYYGIRNYNNAFRRMDSNLPSSTIDCGHRNYFHYSENRVPTVRESARIQSFPDWYVFAGSKTSQYTQVGNAVPPLLASIIAQEIKNII
ncbi:DNA cytosine methyltransferase [Mammaliicoccus sciuri]|uniref:DNA cytosine methyltransferase n=1 Tax=Mammaliicoccus sciuri TaxID=1296 RepID=UPI002175060B|nr:DNA cytosine methyltransferase [Mammaliicoccus sciuri]